MRQSPPIRSLSRRVPAALLLWGGLGLSPMHSDVAIAQSYHRIEVRPAEGKPLPYTMEVPAGWEILQAKETPGLWVGPADAKPPNDPRLIYVRGSRVSLADPNAVADNIRKNDVVQTSWTAPRVEVKDLNGVKAVLVRMDSGEGDGASSTLALKLPLDGMGVDFLCKAGRKDFEKYLSQCERILLSVRPAVPVAAPPK